MSTKSRRSSRSRQLKSAALRLERKFIKKGCHVSRRKRMDTKACRNLVKAINRAHARLR